MTYISKLTISENDMDIEIGPVEDQATLDIEKMLPVVAAQNQEFDKLTHIMLKEQYKSKYLNFEAGHKKKKKKKISKSKQNDLLSTNHYSLNINQRLPKNKELEEVVETLLNSLEIKDYGLKEIHDIVMCFDERYYDPLIWIQMGWALHNTSNLLFWTWILFSCQDNLILLQI